jgi:predicted DNA-binding transcriptional regulator YafY
MARGEQLGRQWRIIQTLIASRKGISVSDLARDLECHPRTVYRDLEALEIAGFPVFTEKRGAKNIWRIMDSARQHTSVPFTLLELMALYFSRGMLKILEDTVFYDALESLFKKIKATIAPEMAAYLKGVQDSLIVGQKPIKHYGQYKETIQAVNQALLHPKRLKIAYYTMSRNTLTERMVSPYKLWFFDGTFYLIGYCHLRKEIRTFALDRIQAIEASELAFRPSKDLDIDGFMRASFGVFQGEKTVVRIHFSKAIAGYVREKNWHATQKIQSQADGSIIYSAEVAGTQEIKYWILKWGAQAKVLAPQHLAREIEQEATMILSKYQQ